MAVRFELFLLSKTYYYNNHTLSATTFENGLFWGKGKDKVLNHKLIFFNSTFLCSLFYCTVCRIKLQDGQWWK